MSHVVRMTEILPLTRTTRANSYIAMSRFTQRWVMSKLWNEWCHTCEWVMFMSREWFYHIHELHVLAPTWHWVTSREKWVMSNIRIGHITYINIWFFLHLWMWHDIYVKITSLVRPSHSYIHRYDTALDTYCMCKLLHTNESPHKKKSCHTYKWVMSHVWMTNITPWMSHVKRKIGPWTRMSTCIIHPCRLHTC